MSYIYLCPVFPEYEVCADDHTCTYKSEGIDK